MFVSVSVSIYSVSSVVILPKYYIAFQPFRADLYTTPRHAKLNLRFEGDRANKVKETMEPRQHSSAGLLYMV